MFIPAHSQSGLRCRLIELMSGGVYLLMDGRIKLLDHRVISKGYVYRSVSIHTYDTIRRPGVEYAPHLAGKHNGLCQGLANHGFEVRALTRQWL